MYGVTDPASARVQPAGRTDLEIARLILLAHAVSAARIEAGRGAFRETCCEEYARRCPDSLAHCVVPGIAGLLSGLVERGDVRLSLVTGNLEPIARLKLARAGIGSHFQTGQGGFGSDAEDRTQLPAIARARSGRGARPHPRQKTLLIGDTPLDIACARADGVQVVAVTTGPYRADQLGHADHVARDVGELRAYLDSVLDAAGSQPRTSRL